MEAGQVRAIASLRAHRECEHGCRRLSLGPAQVKHLTTQTPGAVQRRGGGEAGARGDGKRA